VAGGVAPFEVHVPQHELDDLRERLARTRWLDEFPGSGWSYGTSRRYLEGLCEYWRTEFDWRACEARLNAFGQVAMDVDGQRVHAIHARSPEAGALPLLLVHGWPGSVFEFDKVIEPLRDPLRHGGDASDVPRSWAERLYSITHWNEMPAGGHFPALEQPELFVADLRAFFRQLRADHR